MPTTSEELDKLKDENRKLKDELQTQRQEIEHLIAALEKTNEELTAAKDISAAQQQSVSKKIVTYFISEYQVLESAINLHLDFRNILSGINPEIPLFFIFIS